MVFLVQVTPRMLTETILLKPKSFYIQIQHGNGILDQSLVTNTGVTPFTSNTIIIYGRTRGF